ncbi:protein SOSEKI 2-like [Tasmannia lanceolata]|uniref:protein SOSEKI 2-like n=1 Tax=Tasmannia lanceolata TaxID=3420 RepID=UPI0040629F16
MDIRERMGREMSPDRLKVCMQPKIKALRKVQVVYYLCRNGQLEQPHFMEVPHIANQQLRLKDVMDRLMVLRGSGMPALFSWSCKRSYKNGYVWNDLGENDVIYPANGAEYVLKGSEIIEESAERLQQLQVSNKQQNPELNFQPKRKSLVGNQNREEEKEMGNIKKEEEEEEKASNRISNTPYSEIKSNKKPTTPNNLATELALDRGSPPTVSVKTTHRNSQRFENSNDSRLDSAMTRNSVLFQLFACGSPSTKVRNTHSVKNNSLHKGVLCKIATKSILHDEINYMSENPRFGNVQSEEKEYFSGSMVESMMENRVSAEPSLKKSSSYNEERNLKGGIVQELQKREEEKSMKGKCIPRKRPASVKHPKK